MKQFKYAALAAVFTLGACATTETVETSGGYAAPANEAAAALIAMGLEPSDAAREGRNYIFADVFEEAIDDTLSSGRLVIGDPRMGADGAVELAFIALEDVEMRSKTEGEVAFDRFVIDAPNAALAGDLVAVFSGASESEDHEWRWQDYSFGEVSLNGMTLGFNDGVDNVAGSVDRIAASGMRDGVLGRFEMLDVVLFGTSEGMPVSIAMGEISLDGLDFNKMDMGSLTPASAVDTFGAPISYQMDFYAAAAIRDIDLNAAGLSITLEEMTSVTDRNGDLVGQTSEMSRLVFRPDPTSAEGMEVASGLAMFGYDEIAMNFVQRTVHDERADRVYTEGENYLEIVDALRLDYTMDVAGWTEYQRRYAESVASGALDDPDPVISLGGALSSVFATLTVSDFSLTLTDQSLTDRILTALAAEQGLTADDLRAQAGMIIAMGVMAAPPEIPRPLVSQASAAMTQFVTEGGSVTVRMAPSEPYALSRVFEDIANGGVNFDALGLSVTSE